MFIKSSTCFRFTDSFIGLGFGLRRLRSPTRCLLRPVRCQHNPHPNRRPVAGTQSRRILPIQVSVHFVFSTVQKRQCGVSIMRDRCNPFDITNIIRAIVLLFAATRPETESQPVNLDT